jgi:hypothetical protein
MYMSVTQTDRIVVVDGVRCRIWEGRTGAGTQVVAYVHRVACRGGEGLDLAEELAESRPPSKFAVAASGG